MRPSLILIGGLFTCIIPARADELTVLKPRPGQPGPAEMMVTYLRGLTHEALDRRADQYEKLKTPEQLTAYQQRMREFFIDQLGGFPPRTPLNARVVGRRMRDGYRLEKIIYESHPKVYVTAILYLPLSDPPYPGVLVPCGHSKNGKASEPYQRASILLAKNGLAALCYDPIGQGERYQVLDAEGKPRFGATHEHTLVGVASILLGTNTARYRIWDGMRGIDYLVGRPDIDPQRIGCTGNSGGGTLTSYIMALEPRVLCAAPSCYLTSMRRIMDTIGAQDAEQNIHAQIAHGMEHADYVLMRAPRPTLICAATRDFFDIGGTWHTFREAKRFYTRLGFAERVDLIETDARHGFSTQLRVGMVRWMRRWLLGIDDAVTEPDFPVLTDEELQCSPDGQVMLMEGARSVLDLNVGLEKQFAPQRREFWKSTPKDQALQKVRQIAGIRRLADLPAPEVDEVSTVQRPAYRIDKLVLRPEAGIRLPALLFYPPQAAGGACLYLHGQGKHVDAAPGGPIEKLVLGGYRVLAVDLRGIGETQADLTNYKSWAPLVAYDLQGFFRSYMLGRSYLGMRAEDVLVCARFLAGQRAGEKKLPVHLIALGRVGPPALHAAALEPDVFASVRLERSLTSWSNVVRTPVPRNQLDNTVHGALKTYDLPDLLAALPAEKLTIVQPLNAAQQSPPQKHEGTKKSDEKQMSRRRK